MHQSHAGQQDNIVIPKQRKISLFHNMKFNPILEEQAAAHAAHAAAEQQKKEFGLNPNAPSFNMQQAAYAAHRYVKRSCFLNKFQGFYRIRGGPIIYFFDGISPWRNCSVKNMLH